MMKKHDEDADDKAGAADNQKSDRTPLGEREGIKELARPGVALEPAPEQKDPTREHAVRAMPIGDSRDDKVTRFFITLEKCMAGGKGACDAEEFKDAATEAFEAWMKEGMRLGAPAEPEAPHAHSKAKK